MLKLFMHVGLITLFACIWVRISQVAIDTFISLVEMLTKWVVSVFPAKGAPKDNVTKMNRRV